MTSVFSARTTISRPPLLVWQVLTDWPRAHLWMSGVEAIEADSTTGVGTVLGFHARGKRRTAEITRCTPGRALNLRSEQGGVTADYLYELTEISEGHTRADLVASCDIRGLGWRLLAPLIRFGMRQVDGNQLLSLQRLIESEEVQPTR